MRTRNYDCKELHDIYERVIKTIGFENFKCEIENYLPTDELAEMLQCFCEDYDCEELMQGE